MEIAEFIILSAGLLGAVTAICGFIYGIIKWFQKQDKQSTDIDGLRDTHNEDMRTIKDELCVVSYALLACLDGLMQQGCNGNVTKAHESLEKHLNKKAHDQI